MFTGTGSFYNFGGPVFGFQVPPLPAGIPQSVVDEVVHRLNTDIRLNQWFVSTYGYADARGVNPLVTKLYETAKARYLARLKTVSEAEFDRLAHKEFVFGKPPREGKFQCLECVDAEGYHHFQCDCGWLGDRKDLHEHGTWHFSLKPVPEVVESHGCSLRGYLEAVLRSTKKP